MTESSSDVSPGEVDATTGESESYRGERSRLILESRIFADEKIKQGARDMVEVFGWAAFSLGCFEIKT